VHEWWQNGQCALNFGCLLRERDRVANCGVRWNVLAQKVQHFGREAIQHLGHVRAISFWADFVAVRDQLVDDAFAEFVEVAASEWNLVVTSSALHALQTVNVAFHATVQVIEVVVVTLSVAQESSSTVIAVALNVDLAFGALMQHGHHLLRHSVDAGVREVRDATERAGQLVAVAVHLFQRGRQSVERSIADQEQFLTTLVNFILTSRWATKRTRHGDAKKASEDKSLEHGSTEVKAVNEWEMLDKAFVV